MWFPVERYVVTLCTPQLGDCSSALQLQATESLQLMKLLVPAACGVQPGPRIPAADEALGPGFSCVTAGIESSALFQLCYMGMELSPNCT